MSLEQKLESPQQNHGNLSIKDLYIILKENILIWMLSTAIVSCLTAIYVFSLPYKYQSTAVMAPSNSSDSLGLGQLSGIASLAGINLSSGEQIDKTDMAIEILKSHDFLSRFIDDNGLKAPLIAAKSWDEVTDEVIYDLDLYDFESRTWALDPDTNETIEPTAQESVAFFRESMLLSKDKVNGIIRIGFTHVDPNLARWIVSNLVSEINEHLRQRDAKESADSIEYLEAQLTDTKNIDIRSTLYSLIEEQTQTQMLTQVRQEYVFTYIDKPLISEEPVGMPKLVIVLALCCIYVFLIAAVIVFVVLFRKLLD